MARNRPILTKAPLPAPLPRRVLNLTDSSYLDELPAECRAALGASTLIVAHTPDAALASATMSPDLIVIGAGYFERWGGLSVSALRRQAATEHTPIVVLTAQPGARAPEPVLTIGSLSILDAGLAPAELGRALLETWRNHRAPEAAPVF